MLSETLMAIVNSMKALGRFVIAKATNGGGGGGHWYYFVFTTCHQDR